MSDNSNTINKEKVGFNENDLICKRCIGCGNQLFQCHYCAGYDHYYRCYNRKEEEEEGEI